MVMVDLLSNGCILCTLPGRNVLIISVSDMGL